MRLLRSILNAFERVALTVVLSLALGSAPASANSGTNDSHILIQTHGPSALREYLMAMRQAQESIEIESYAFKHDRVGELILFEALSAAARGVRVRILLDGWGTDSIRPRAARGLARAGVETRYFNARFGWPLPRTHRKLLIVDRRRLIFGGRNLSASNFGIHANERRMDYSFEVQGAVVAQALASFDQFWAVSQPGSSLSPLSQRTDAVPLIPQLEDLSSQSRQLRMHLEAPSRTRHAIVVSVGQLEFVTDGPSHRSRVYVTRLIRELSERGRDVVLESPVYAIGSRVAEAFRTLLLRGTPVQLIVSQRNGSSDRAQLAFSFGQAIDERDLFDLGAQLLHLGVSRPSETSPDWPSRSERQTQWPSHCKSTIFNDRDAIVGSYNYDALSELYNLESGVLATDSPDLVRVLRELQRARISGSEGFSTIE